MTREEYIEMEDLESSEEQLNLVEDDQIRTDLNLKKNVSKEKKKKNKNKGLESKSVKSKQIIFDMSDKEEFFENFFTLLKKVNNKNIGKKILKEDFFEMLIRKVDDQFIFDLQKLSVTSQELDEIIRQNLIQ